MRKFVLPLLMAGALAFTASSAMAGTFTEETSNGNHYKTTDVEESGHTSYQLDSTYLKGLANGTYDGDESYGYTSGANPFVQGYMIDPYSTGSVDSSYDDNTSFLMEPPAYTSPCPPFMDTNGEAGGGCIANTYATDPQSEHSGTGLSYTMLDDLYQSIGVDDSDGVDTTRFLGQDLDILVFVGKQALSSGLGLDSNGDGFYDKARWGTDANNDGIVETFNANDMSSQYHFVMDQTLDQDLGDWTGGGAGNGAEGIYGKFTQLIELAGAVYSNGCVSAKTTGDYLNSTECAAGTNAPPRFSYQLDPAIDYNSEAAGTGTQLFTWEQLMISEVWDWEANANPDVAGKVDFVGMKQGYHSYWGSDAPEGNFDFTNDINGGHGDVDDNVSDGHDHIDP